MRKADARRYRAFIRQQIAYERALSRRIRAFLNKEQSSLMRMALDSDWDGFHDKFTELQEPIKRTMSFIVEDVGKQTTESLK